MKKNRSIIIVTLVLSIAAAIVFYNIQKPKPKESLKDFALADTSVIDKIILSDNSAEQSVTLTKESNGMWKVNGAFFARKDMIKNMLTAIKKVTVKSPVAKAAQENVIKRLAVQAIKVEIFEKDKKLKCYFIGSATQDQTGTFMLMENSSEPYICFLPGHHGFLTNFFIPAELQWRDRVIYAYQLEEITAVSVNFNLEHEQDFMIETEGKNSFKLKSLKSNMYVNDFDTSALKSYLREFKNVAFEDFTSVPATKMDSVRRKYQLFTITVKEKSGQSRWVKGYQIPMPPGTTDVFGTVVAFDPDRMYGEISGVKEQVILQYLTFDRVTKPLIYFLKNPQTLKNK